ncbi:DUF6199 family natural product biosynthesis protein [Oceanobacillus sojae]|uniref:DUF6199 family natural product biosynthesis protein n=1 Tax=Oceanobacillus sojae TaxID=582851 RepID=UPI0034C6A73A
MSYLSFECFISIFSPRTAWWLSIGWHFKDAEPSSTALKMNRVGGVFMIVVAIVMIYLVAARTL